MYKLIVINGIYKEVIKIFVMYKFMRNVFVGVCMFCICDMIVIMILLVGMVSKNISMFVVIMVVFFVIEYFMRLMVWYLLLLYCVVDELLKVIL